jgi:hypothetical protein
MREHLSARSAEVVWFDPLSPDAIADALNNLVDNYETYRSAALAGVDDLRPTWDDIAAQYVGVFRNVIPTSKLPAANSLPHTT